jgi:DUF971 family protein
MNPRVKNVVPIEDYNLKIQFNNGEEGIYDCIHLLDFGVFKELKFCTSVLADADI